MSALAIVAGVVVLALVLWDTFETIVLSKTVARRMSLTTLLSDGIWRMWRLLVRLSRGNFRQWVLVSFGPLALLLLISAWAVLLVLGYALIHWGAGTLDGCTSFPENLYFSGVTFFTLGYGDFAPTQGLGRTLAVLEAGMGLGFLAVVIAYVPQMYSLFSRREHMITLLDSKAGSNPSAGELLKRHAEGGAIEELITLLKEWERWSAEQLEAYLSYPIMAYYRSQHDDQSWLLSLTCILDACALISVGFEGEESLPWAKRLHFQAKATFAMARHVIVDLAYIVDVPPDPKPFSRCSPGEYQGIVKELARVGMPIRSGREEVLKERLATYEPYVVSLAKELYFTLPAWTPAPDAVDNWQTSAWESPTHF